ncbi:hypothetical protein F0562_029376 [Nyssa sinensis]|uniref:TPM domain-containing protein n=1 Tax=Nyssa sinensis TaxID=561372 RepID=A0A5J5B2N3_9ASTE|nr:hypothetical protein F0562_029376 [Nyssa sinensis]
METILSPHSLCPLFSTKPASSKTLLSPSLQPKLNSVSLIKPICSSLKRQASQSIKQSLPIPTSWFSHVHHGLAALALSLALNFCPILPIGSALASEFDVLNDGPPKESYVVDDAGVLSRVTRSDLKRLLSDLESRKNLHINFITVRKLTSKADAFEYADQVLERWYPTVEEGDNKGIVVLVTSQKEGAITGGPSFVKAIGDTILDATVSENLPGNHTLLFIVQINDLFASLDKLYFFLEANSHAFSKHAHPLKALMLNSFQMETYTRVALRKLKISPPTPPCRASQSVIIPQEVERIKIPSQLKFKFMEYNLVEKNQEIGIMVLPLS